MTSHNFYTILGIPRHADEKAIRAAYRDLARQYHPDSAYFNPTTNITFSDITQAYETLRDPIKRARYDARLRASTHSIRRTHTQSTGSTTARPPYSHSSRPQYRQRTRNASKQPVYPPPKARPNYEIRKIVGFVVVILMVFVSSIVGEEYGSNNSNTFDWGETLDANDVTYDNNPTIDGWRQTQATVDRVSTDSCQTLDTPCQNVFYHFEINGRTYHNQTLVNATDYEVGDRLTIYYSTRDPDQSFIVPR